MTVSRVLNEPWKVRPSTRERVQSAITELGYRPNTLARSLAAGRSRSIGVICLSTVWCVPSTIIGAVERAARDADLALFILMLESPQEGEVRSAVRRLIDRGVDGVVAVTATPEAAEALLAPTETVPVAAIHHGRAWAQNTDAERIGARLATEHLLRLGHPSVHHVAGPQQWPQARARREGWEDAMRAADRRLPPLLMGDWSAASGYGACRALAARADLTAVFVANDQMALGVLRALHDGGRSVPEDVSVAAIEDLPVSTFCRPPLTTVRHDQEGLGEQIIDLLLTRPATPDGHTLKRPRPPQLIIRASTAAPPP